jgi:transposase
MRKIREVLRLHHEFNLSQKKIAISVAIGQATVYEYLCRAKNRGLIWPLPDDLDDDALEKLLFPVQSNPNESRAQPDFEMIHKEIKRKGVTLALLWEEYIVHHPGGYKYSAFCKLYQDWAKERDLWMPQQHKMGEKLFIDYAGLTVPIYNTDGSSYEAQIFVATMGASNYTFAEATQTQQLHDWIGSHVRMLDFFGGITEVWVPDNLRCGVKSSHRYDPELNPTYLKMAEYYSVAVIPARVRTPRDKSKVEKGVQDVERQILARIRNLKFFSLEELNATIGKLLKEFNQRPFQKMSGCRLSQFEELDKPHLKPLPPAPFVFEEWLKARIGQNYHINVLGHYYSTPYDFVKQEVIARITENTIEIYLKNNRIASHVRSFVQGGYTTSPNHRPPNHKFYAECTPEYLLEQAKKIGELTTKWVETVLSDESRHLIQRCNNCMGAIRLAKSYGEKRLELACQRGLDAGLFSCKNIESILKTGLDQRPLKKAEIILLPQTHECVRGASYYN